MDFRRAADHLFPEEWYRRLPPGYVFLFFCGMMVLQLIWVKVMVPETKGVPLEQMQEKLGITLADPTEASPAGEASNRTGGR